MATDNIYPNGDAANQWYLHAPDTTNPHNNVEEGDPPDTGDLNGAGNINGDDNQYEQYSLTSIAGISEATQAVVYVYGKSSASPYMGDIEVDFFDGSDWQGAQALGLNSP